MHTLAASLHAAARRGRVRRMQCASATSWAVAFALRLRAATLVAQAPPPWDRAAHAACSSRIAALMGHTSAGRHGSIAVKSKVFVPGCASMRVVVHPRPLPSSAKRAHTVGTSSSWCALKLPLRRVASMASTSPRVQPVSASRPAFKCMCEVVSQKLHLRGCSQGQSRSRCPKFAHTSRSSWLPAPPSGHVATMAAQVLPTSTSSSANQKTR